MKKKQSQQVKRANNVFLNLGFPPHEAAVMLLRCELAEALRKWMEREAISQVEAAKRLGVVQPRISEIARNKVDKLSLDYLVGLCAKAGLSVAVESSGGETILEL
jgi:predicted XRE-type DNA-binding protein